MKTPWTFDQPLCAEIGPLAYFPASDDNAEREIVTEQEHWKIAKKLCKACKHQKDCLDWALETKEGYGIWGGMSTQERREYSRMQKARKINEPTAC
jgi:WhiB family redox-sensing transcriptional regulator